MYWELCLAESHINSELFVHYRNECSTNKKVTVEVRCSLRSSVQSAAVATTAAALLLYAPIGEVNIFSSSEGVDSSVTKLRSHITEDFV